MPRNQRVRGQDNGTKIENYYDDRKPNLGDLVSGLVGEITETVREKRGKPAYLYLHETASKVLYAILKLHQKFLKESREGELSLPKVNEASLAKQLGFEDVTSVNRAITQLRRANYVVSASVQTGHPGHQKRSPQYFEVQVKTCITCKDTAKLLLELSAFSKTVKDAEGKVLIEDFLMHLGLPETTTETTPSKKLEYFDRQDLLGTDAYKGKINELAESGEHVERISAKHIRPRMKLALELPYLKLLAHEDITLKDLPHYRFDKDTGEWVPGQLFTAEEIQPPGA